MILDNRSLMYEKYLESLGVHIGKNKQEALKQVRKSYLQINFTSYNKNVQYN